MAKHIPTTASRPRAVGSHNTGTGATQTVRAPAKPATIFLSPEKHYQGLRTGKK
ncbi:MAG: hypothetical protein ACP5QA_14770 [Phycisphaerae bacterium]